MNRFAITPSWLLFVLLAGILAVFYYHIYVKQKNTLYILDSFEDGSDSVRPSSEDLEAANAHYAALLLFLQKYPAASIPFIKDMKDKLYGETCTVKPSIDFKNIATFQNGMVFI